MSKVFSKKLAFIILLLLFGQHPSHAQPKVAHYASITYIDVSKGATEDWELLAGLDVEWRFSDSLSGFVGMGLSLPMVWNADVAERTETVGTRQRSEGTVRPSEQVGENHQGVPFQARTGLVVEPFGSRGFTPYIRCGVAAAVTRFEECQDSDQGHHCDIGSEGTSIGILAIGGQAKRVFGNNPLRMEVGFHKAPNTFEAITFKLSTGF